MSFLKFTPTVFVVGDEYEIVIVAEKNGIFSVNAWGKEYYEENSGVLPSEKNYAKIRVPQSVLNGAKRYTVTFREAINRKGYFSDIGKTQIEKFTFKPVLKTEDIKVYHLADVHYAFEMATKTADYFGEDVDLFIFNGDIGEVESVELYEQTLEFVGNITQGRIPTIYSRGNHDARGKLAERFTDYFPAEGKKTYYTFDLGAVCGLVLDCGEDKWDNHADYNFENPYNYNGVNIFEDYRRREYKWLTQLEELPKDKVRLIVSHICPSITTDRKGSAGDIEQLTYTAWNQELDRIGMDFMICGHLHKQFVADESSPKNILPHKYPVIVGSALGGRYEGGKLIPTTIRGTALTINSDHVDIEFTDQEHKVLEKHLIKFNK